MKDQRKTKAQLINEIVALRQQVAGFEVSGPDRKKAEKKYGQLLEDINDGYAVIQDGKIVFANGRFSEIFGYKQGHVLGKTLTHFVMPDTGRAMMDLYKRTMQGEELPAERRELVGMQKDGTAIIIETNGKVIQYENKPAFGVTVRDVTKRKLTEEVLRYSEEYFRLLIENLSDVILIMDADGTVSYLGPSVKHVLGYKPEERIGKPGFDLIHPDDLPAVIKAFGSNSRKPGQSEPMEMRIRHKDGSWRIVRGVSNNLLGCFPVSGIVVSFHDITERKSAEEALRQSEEKYRAIFDNALDGIVLVDSQTGLITECNAAFEKQTGRRIQKLRKLKVWEIRPPEKFKAARQKFMEINEKGYGGSSELDFQRPSGVCVPIEFVSRRVNIGGKEYLLGMSRDITERKYTEERILSQKELLESTLESLTHPFYVVNTKNYSIEMANSATLPGDTLLNQKCYAVTHGNSEPCSGTEHICPMKQVVETGRPVIVEHIHINELGNKHSVEVHGYPIFDKEGNVVRMITYYIDITERKKLDQLKDDFISLVSHELRSPLTVITGAVNTVLTEGDRLSAEETHQLITDAAYETDMLSHLLSNLLELSRAQANRLLIYAEPVEMARVIKDTIREIERQSSKHRFIVSVPKKLPMAYADQLRLERVLYNLLDNAIKFSPQGGDIRVSVKSEEEYLLVAVRDKGIGISASNQAKLFGPFQRVEDSRLEGIGGSGLGLMVCRRLVEAHGGRIWMESKPGKGSAFFFTVPKAPVESE